MLFLTTDEIKELTGRTHKNAQVAELNRMGIQHRVRADGSPAVLASHIEECFGGKSSKRVVKRIEPDWSQCNA